MSSLFKILFLLIAVIPLCSCATILSGTSQTLTIETNPNDARCELKREGRVIGSVSRTPGAVTIRKSKHDIDVNCEKEGYTESKAFIDSGIESATFGNILLGGFIGWGIDSAVGADNKYQEQTTVTLNPMPIEVVKKEEVATNSSQNIDLITKLRNLKELKDSGIITNSEYQVKRKIIISNL